MRQSPSANSTNFKLNQLPPHPCSETFLPSDFKVGQFVIDKYDNKSFPWKLTAMKNDKSKLMLLCLMEINSGYSLQGNIIFFIYD